MSEAHTFLKQVWESSNEGYRFFAYFDESHNFTEVTLKQGDELEIPNEGVDVYFCPNHFSKSKRQKPFALPGRWLYADLDEADPYRLRIPPTIAWQTSLGRYQAMWRLKKAVTPKTLETLNQRMTYATQADRGGWSLTKVLRVPGTESHKREEPYMVNLLWDDGDPYSPKELWSLLKHVQTPGSATGSDKLPVNLPTKKSVLGVWRTKLPTRAKKLLRTKTVLSTDDRSARAWELSNLLLDTGLSPEETFVLVKRSVWNKYKGQRREDTALWTEITKANAKERIKPKSKRTRKRQEATDTDDGWISSERAQMEILEPPSWLVDGVWSDQAHGLIAGSPKSYKSTIALDLAISVATGSKFLDHFEVAKSGPVLYINEENDPPHMHWLHNLILESRGKQMRGGVTNGRLSLDLNSPELYFRHMTGFSLTDDIDHELLEASIQKYEPALVVLDPFYRVAPGVDENSAMDVSSVLSPLIDLKQEYGCGMLIIHHYSKQNQQFPRHKTERVSGSGVFGRWFESAVYLEKTDDPSTVRMATEHRKHGESGDIEVSIDLGGHGHPAKYEVGVQMLREEEAENYDRLRRILSDAGEHGVPISSIADLMGLNPGTVRKRLDRMPDVELVEGRSRGTRGRPAMKARLRP